MDINKSQPEKQQEFPTEIVVNEGEDNLLWAIEQKKEQKKKQVEEEGKRLNDLESYLKTE